MKCGFGYVWAVPMLVMPLASGISRAADVGWPEAVALAGERAKAETCAALLKGHGNKEQISRGQLAYGDAKSNFLTRELFDDGGPEKTWLIDTTVRAKAPLLDQVPEGVDTSAWRVAVVKLSDSITASGRLVGRAYDDQPLINLKVRIVENQASETALGASNQKSGAGNRRNETPLSGHL